MNVSTRTTNLFLCLAPLVLAGCHHKDRADPPLADMVDAPHIAAPKRPSDVWTTYGHDPARTGASTESCRGPLKLLWRFKAPSIVASHAIVTKDAVYASGQAGDAPALLRVSLSGKPGWSFNSRADVTRGRWPNAALGHIILNDDGFFWLSPQTGKRFGPHWLDLWGQTLSDGKRLYAVNELHLDGPGVFVGAFDASVKPLWKANKYIEKHGRLDVLGAIALDGGTLFQAAHFRGAALSGLFALDPSTGKRRWAQRVYPDSAVSAAHGRLFLAEMSPDSKVALFSRKQSDGSVVWSVPVDDTDHQAPVIAGDRVISYGPKTGIVARDAKSGKMLWKSGLIMPGKDRPGYSTSLSAALGSRTLVAASGPELAVLSLDTGKVQWKGNIDSTLGNLHSPVIAGGRVYVVSHGSVLALSCKAP